MASSAFVFFTELSLKNLYFSWKSCNLVFKLKFSSFSDNNIWCTSSILVFINSFSFFTWANSLKFLIKLFCNLEKFVEFWFFFNSVIFSSFLTNSSFKLLIWFFNIETKTISFMAFLCWLEKCNISPIWGKFDLDFLLFVGLLLLCSFNSILDKLFSITLKPAVVDWSHCFKISSITLMVFWYSSFFLFLFTFNKEISLFLDANSALNLIIMSLLRSNSNSNIFIFSLVLLYVPWWESSFIFNVLKYEPFNELRSWLLLDFIFYFF